MAETDSHDRWPGALSARYRYVGAIGEGGMGLVFKAIDTHLRRPVAIKAISQRRLSRGVSTSGLRAEALAAARLDHPYICKIYELIEDGDETYIVMEFVEGETLAAILQRERPALAMTVRIAVEIAEGLADAHEHGLVHRDVKPANVMVTPHGHIKLLDFGLAHPDVAAAPAAATHTRPPGYSPGGGTAQYMSPEQATEAPVTARADLFSLGVVIFECLTGRLPFEGASGYDYVRHLLSDAPLPLYRLAPTAPDDLVQLVEQCLEKSPARRPESAADVRARLARIADGMTSTGLAPLTARAAQARRRLRRAAAVAAVVALAGIGLWTWRRGGEPPVIDRQLRPFTTTAGAEFESRLSPDGRWISFVASRGGARALYVQRADGDQAQRVALPAGVIESQLWSPDGETLVCLLWQGDDLSLQVVPAFFGGVPLRSFPLRPAPRAARLLRWSDGTLYVQVEGLSARGMALFRVDPGDQSFAEVDGPWARGGSVRWLDVAPDGRQVVFAQTEDGRSDLWVADLRGGPARRLTHDAFFERFPIWTADARSVIYQSNRGGQTDLWELPVAEGAEPRPLTAGPSSERPDSAAPNGSVTFENLSDRTALWLWDRRRGGPGRAVTSDALNDLAPVASRDGQVVAFQRSLAAPLEGSLPMDSRLFVGRLDPAAGSFAPREVGVGFAPQVSPDGTLLAYFRRADSSQLELRLKHLATDRTVTLSTSAAMLSVFNLPVDWLDQNLAWAPSSEAVYFAEHVGGYRLLRYRVGTERPEPLESTAAAGRLTDVHASANGRHLAYVAHDADAYDLRAVDLQTGASRRLASFPRGQRIYSRGWTQGDAGVLALRVTDLYDDGSRRFEVLVVRTDGRVEALGTVDRAWPSTARLVAAESALYVTQVRDGVANVQVYALATRALRQVSENAQVDASFSAVVPIGSDWLLGVRHERQRDIWLLEARRPDERAGVAGR